MIMDKKLSISEVEIGVKRKGERQKQRTGAKVDSLVFFAMFAIFPTVFLRLFS